MTKQKGEKKELIDHRVVLLGAGDSTLRRDALDGLTALSDEQDELDIESFTADSRSPAEWLGAAGTAPFLSRRRIVVVRSVGRVPPERAYPDSKAAKGHPFAVEAAALPETALLILVADDEGGADDSIQRSQAAGEKWKRIVELAGGRAIAFESKPAEVVAMVREEASRQGKEMSARAAQTLVDMVSGRPSLALDEVQKLAIYAGAAPKITEQDVRDAVAPELDFSIWQLADAVLQGKAGQALTHFDRLRARHSKLQDQAFQTVFPVLMNQIRLIWQARAEMEGKGAEGALAGKGALGSQAEWRLNRIRQSARRLSFDQLAECIAAVHRADLELKGRRPSAGDARETLEQMILKMAQAAGG